MSIQTFEESIAQLEKIVACPVRRVATEIAP
jgi:hypothetical protein